MAITACKIVSERTPELLNAAITAAIAASWQPVGEIRFDPRLECYVVTLIQGVPGGDQQIQADFTALQAAIDALEALSVDCIEATGEEFGGGSTGVPYSATVEGAGGDGGPYTFSLAYGALPDDLTLDSASGEVSGTPSQDGDFVFGIAAVDGTGRVGIREFAVTIATE